MVDSREIVVVEDTTAEDKDNKVELGEIGLGLKGANGGLRGGLC